MDVRRSRPRTEDVPAGWKLGWGLLLLAATTAPYLWFRATTPPGFVYTWVLPPYLSDMFAYMAWARQAVNGHLLFTLKYTALPHAPFLFHPLFLLSGWIARVTQLDLGLVHLLLKMVGVTGFVFAFFAFLRSLRLTRRTRVLAALLVATSSGFGGAALWLFGPATVERLGFADLWIVDLNTFWSLLWNPLFPFSLSLVLVCLTGLVDRIRDARPSAAWVCGLCAGALAVLHPYPLPWLLCLIAAASLLHLPWREAVSTLARVFTVATPFFLYVFLLSWRNPLVVDHSAAGVMQSPPLPAYLFGLGIPLLLALPSAFAGRGERAGAADAGRVRDPRDVGRFVLVGWILASLSFAYFPIWFQMKSVFGLHVPVCILAAITLDALYRRLLPSRAVAFATLAALLVVSATTHAVVLQRQAETVRANADGTIRIPGDLFEALDFLRVHTRPEDVVLASVRTSTLIPAYAGNTVLWGHWAQSVDQRERGEWFRREFGAGPHSAQEQRRALEEAGVRYVLVDPSLGEMLGSGARPWTGDGARLVFEKGAVRIFALEPGAAPSP